MATKKTLYARRHTVLYAKGHYVSANLCRDLMALEWADWQSRTATITQINDALATVAADALKNSDDIVAELKSHANYLRQRSGIMLTAQAEIGNLQTADLVEVDVDKEYIPLETAKKIVDTLVTEALLAIIARWRLPDNLELGEADPDVLPVRDPKIERK